MSFWIFRSTSPTRLLATLALGWLMLTSVGRAADYSVEIDLQEQRAYLLRNRRVVLETPISTGRAKYRTPTGNFKITEKDMDHRSSLYGKIVDASGRTLVADADADMPVPRGGKFVNAPMHYFMRFTGAIGMHAGHLPGYPASHGCVRLPKERAAAFYKAVQVGTPVTVFGTTATPATRRQEQRHEPEWPRERRFWDW